MKLGLGTVQFGLPYGVANSAGMTQEAEVARILELAASHGISVLDTAPAYGEAEAVLGRLVAADSAFRIVTKTVRLAASPREDAFLAVTSGIAQSLERLGRKSVAAVLVHEIGDLLGEQGDLVAQALQQARNEGIAEKIGFSAYTAEQVWAAAELLSPDIVQIPVSILDQRLIADGTLERLARAGVEVHARSALLQGLVCMDAEKAASRLPQAAAAVRKLADFREQRGLSADEAALAFMRSVPGIDTVVIGVESAAQLAENIAAFEVDCGSLSLADFAPLAVDDVAVVDPRRWDSR